MDPREYPGDELIARWSRDYGTTGVKFYELLLSSNEGCIAAYRELSLQERMLLGRLDELDESDPDAFDIKRMTVSLCLLHPTLDAFPHPVFAVGELYSLVRQHGHGPIDEDEALYGPLPAHMATDIRNARRAAQLAFEDGRYTSIYKDLLVSLAVQNGMVDIQLLAYLWRQTPGQLRDLLSVLEQSHHILHTELSTNPKVDQQKLATLFQSPFAVLDAETLGATVPGFSEEPVEDSAPAVTLPTMTGLPPNSPPTTEAFRRAIEGPSP